MVNERDGFYDRFLIVCPHTQRLNISQVQQWTEKAALLPVAYKDFTPVLQIINNWQDSSPPLKFTLAPHALELFKDYDKDSVDSFNKDLGMTDRTSTSKDTRHTLR
jgi:hypothetical protein